MMYTPYSHLPISYIKQALIRAEKAKKNAEEYVRNRGSTWDQIDDWDHVINQLKKVLEQ